MASVLSELHLDAHDPVALARFWAETLAREPDPTDPALLPPGTETTFPLRFVGSRRPKTLPNLAHADLATPSAAAQQELVERALGLGASHLDVGQRPEEGHVVLADPEGNEFCVTVAGSFLAGCGLFGALSSDGSHALGVFWSRALHWPLVWDEGEETAVQSPAGGTKIAWGGPPYTPKPPRSRVRFHLTAPRDGLDAEKDRLVSLGATLVEPPRGENDPLALLDPDGNDFSLSAAGV